ncbi:adenosine kinase [Candidatus Woesearchaeota archaeon]|nr:adenosine kinase [Candidatus Woesearchaeota archaeon]
MTYDLYSIGNPLMDFLIEVDDAHLSSLGLAKGNFNLVDQAGLKEFESKLGALPNQMAPGGSAANSMAIFSMLGGKGFFCGRVGKDNVALQYSAAMRAQGVNTHLAQSASMTGRAFSLITPDTERTMIVHLGAAVELSHADIDLEALKQSKMLYLTGYVLEDPNLRKAALHALDFAKQNDIRIAIDVADPGVVERAKEDLLQILAEFADIIFANDAEAMTLTGADSPGLALDKIATMCDIAVVKTGKEGSLIKQGDQTVHIEPNIVEAKDTTGAGDSYAGAFLFALSQGHDIEKAGKLASFISSKVVEQVGARLNTLPDVSHIL